MKDNLAINMVACDGNLTADPIVRKRKIDNVPIVVFTLAQRPRAFTKIPVYNKQGKRMRNIRTFIPCVCYDELAQWLVGKIEAGQFKKGSYVFVYGGLLWNQYRTAKGWTKVLNVRVERLGLGDFTQEVKNFLKNVELLEDPETGT